MFQRGRRTIITVLLAGLLSMVLPPLAAYPADPVSDRIVGHAVGEPSSTFRALTPTRLLDTRTGLGAPAGQLPAGGTLTLPITGLSGVPASNIAAVVVNLTITNPRAGGHLIAWPGQSTEPLASTVNFTSGQTIANLAVIPVGTDGAIQLGKRTPAGTDVIVDITGYLTASSVHALTWTGAPALPQAPQGTPNGMSCATRTFCMAVDGRGSAIRFDGTSWSSPVSVSPLVALTSVSCPTSTFCLAADVAGNAISYNGSSWTSPAPAIEAGALDTVSCASNTFCVAFDGVNKRAVVFDGKNWSAPVVIDDSYPTELSCPAADFCLAIDQLGRYLTFDGATWSAPQPVSYEGMVSPGASRITCPSSQLCFALTGDGAVAFDGVA